MNSADFPPLPTALAVFSALTLAATLYETVEHRNDLLVTVSVLEREIVRLQTATASDALDRHAALVVQECVASGRKNCTIMLGYSK